MTLKDNPSLVLCGGLVLWAGVACLPAQAQDSPVVAPPEKRSTPESIRFESIEEERLGETTIEGALGPPAAGLLSGKAETVVEPVHMSDALRRSLDLEKNEAQTQRSLLFGIERDLVPRSPNVQRPAFENRTYSPSSSTSTTVRE